MIQGFFAVFHGAAHSCITSSTRAYSAIPLTSVSTTPSPGDRGKMLSSHKLSKMIQRSICQLWGSQRRKSYLHSTRDEDLTVPAKSPIKCPKLAPNRSKWSNTFCPSQTKHCRNIWASAPSSPSRPCHPCCPFHPCHRYHPCKPQRNFTSSARVSKQKRDCETKNTFKNSKTINAIYTSRVKTLLE